jgi:outer membrane lipoprotein-sorting protein
MKNIFKLGFAAIALGLFFNAFAVTETRAQGLVDTILKKMDAQYKALQTLQGNVKMTKYDSVLQDSDVTEGTMKFVPIRGGDPYVRVDWSKPRNEILSSYQGRYVAYQPSVPKCFEGETKKAKSTGKASNALTFMNMNREQLKNSYSVRYMGEEKLADGTVTWHLELTPKTAQSYKSADLWVDGNGMPRQARIVEKNNDTTTVLLSGLDLNKKINGSLFKVDVPKSVRCVAA